MNLGWILCHFELKQFGLLKQYFNYAYTVLKISKRPKIYKKIKGRYKSMFKYENVIFD